MKYLGHASNIKYYSVFEYEKTTKRRGKINKNDLNLREFLINNFGFIKFDKNLYILLREFGSFINGTKSIIFKWANFSANIGKFLKQEEIVSLLLKNTEVERYISDAKKVYDKDIKNLKCVWSDKKLTSKNYEVDHV